MAKHEPLSAAAPAWLVASAYKSLSVTKVILQEASPRIASLAPALQSTVAQLSHHVLLRQDAQRGRARARVLVR